MMFFTRPKNGNGSVPDERMTLGKLLKPDFSGSIRPIGQNIRTFTRIMGILFAAQGLFPANHPALLDDNSTAPLSLRQILITGWHNLSFTEKDIPKILFFFAVIATLAVTGTIAIFGFLSLFIGSAHAAPSTYFTPPAGDLGQAWIDYLFKGQALPGSLDQAGSNITQASNINLQCSMITMLGFYSSAILIVAAALLFYHLATLVVETAHHGKIMGKSAQENFWAPIRLVFAIGLLVPLGGTGPNNCSATSGAGLNSAQYITIRVAELGSALASNAWDKFINALGGATWGFVPPPTPQVDKIVADIFMMEGCRAAWNHFNGQSTLPSPDDNIPTPTQITDADQYRWTYGPASMSAVGICGTVTIALPPKTPDNSVGGYQASPANIQVYQAIYKAHKDTLETMMAKIRPIAEADISYYIPEWNGSLNGDVAPKNNQDFQDMVREYYTTLKTNLNGAYGTMPPANIKNNSITRLGWIAAGAWFNIIARDQGSLNNATYDGAPKTSLPKIAVLANNNNGLSFHTLKGIAAFREWMSSGYANPTSAAQNISPCDANLGLSGRAGKDEKDEGTGPFLAVLRAFDELASDSGVWGDKQYNVSCRTATAAKPFSLGVQFRTNNPLGELVAYGHKSIHVAVKAFDDILYGMMAQVVGSLMSSGSDTFQKLQEQYKKDTLVSAMLKTIAPFTSTIGKLMVGGGSAVAMIAGLIATIFMTIGVTLGFILPLFPFMHFFFAVVSWGLVLLEGVVAMPLVALVHISPRGEGLPSEMGKKAYQLLFGLFLHPILTLFGLIVSLLIFMMAIFLLNKLYALTVIGTGGFSEGYSTISRLVYMVLYVFLSYTAAVNCFKFIDDFPQSVAKWASLELHHPKIGDAGNSLQTAGTIVAGYAAQQLTQGMQQASGALNNVSGAVGEGGARALSGLTNMGQNRGLAGRGSVTGNPPPSTPPAGGGSPPPTTGGGSGGPRVP